MVAWAFDLKDIRYERVTCCMLDWTMGGEVILVYIHKIERYMLLFSIHSIGPIISLYDIEFYHHFLKYSEM